MTSIERCEQGLRQRPSGMAFCEVEHSTVGLPSRFDSPAVSRRLRLVRLSGPRQLPAGTCRSEGRSARDRRVKTAASRHRGQAQIGERVGVTQEQVSRLLTGILTRLPRSLAIDAA